MNLPTVQRGSRLLLLFAGLILASCSDDRDGQHPGLSTLLPPPSRMNVLIVSFDALRADALGLYGYARNTSPNLDAFAQRSLVFDSAYAAAPVTPTSFSAAFTGQHPYRVFLGWQLIPALTVAQMMKDAGYSTFGLFNNVQLAPQRNFGQGFDHFRGETWPDRQVLNDTKAKLRELKNEQFFGWVHFISPHTPYDYREMSSHLAPLQSEGRFARSSGGKFEVKNDEELARVRDLYDGEVFFADHLFGKLMEFLEQSGLAEKTIVIVTADHGEGFMDHGLLQHKALYEEVIRIPMIIHDPRMTTGQHTELPYTNIDLLPTLASMLGISLDPALIIDGIDLFQPFDKRRPRIITGMTDKHNFHMANVTAGKKLIQVCTPEFREELYDLEQDPLEQNDLILDRPGLAGELSDALLGITVTEPCELIRNSNRGKAPHDLMSPEQIEELKSLGYIQ